ncbi:MAG: LemA family protein [Bacteroidales bacterium]|nr:LemA family protein [Bacteroidales bacterium]
MTKKFAGLGCLAILLVVVLMVGCSGISTYNTLVTQDENVNKTLADMQTQYQRRADLIPNLVATVKGYAAHEQATLQGVVEARAKATQITLDASDLTPEKMQQYEAAQTQLSQALGKLLMVQEQYPQLKADAQFSTLQAQLEGTENRIAESRRLFNESVQSYNQAVRTFPASIFASLMGFERRQAFQAAVGAEQAPSVQF